MIGGTLLRIIILVIYKFSQLLLTIILTIPTRLKKPRTCPPIEDNILLYSATSLAEMIRIKEIASETVIKAYISRIKAVNPIINAVVQDRFDQAVDEAKHVDQMLSNTHLDAEELKIRYPLLGLPLTVKESISVEGLSHCAGRIFPGGQRIAMKDSEAVKLCKEAGAIVLLVSNTPEMSSNYETYNKITGTTCNPYDDRRTPGGSSGGEAALLASAASVMGIGTDLAGSIRLPAHFCGIWGHKSSVNAVSSVGHYPNGTDGFNRLFCMGPMCRYAVDLSLLYNVILKKDFAPLLKLNDEIDIAKLNFYCIKPSNRSILLRKVDSDILNATQRLLNDLSRKHGSRVQELDIPELKLCLELANINLLSSLGLVEDFFGHHGEGAFKELFRYLTCRSPFTLAFVMGGILRRLNSLLPRSTILNCNEKLLQLKKKLCDVLGPDGVLVYPTHSTAAHFHGEIYGRYIEYSEMSIFNCLGFPVTNCPLGLNSKGLPIGVQVVAAPNNDRLTLGVAKEIEKAFGGWIPPPSSNHISS